jgi:SAM-dependent methyltransferase
MSSHSSDHLISHLAQPAPSGPHRAAVLQVAAERLRAAGDLPGATVAQQLELLHELSSSELGMFLLEHRGLNGYWTHRVVSYDAAGEAAAHMSPLERRMFETLPVVLATRERYGIFRRQLQALLAPGLTLASVPCGWMGELLLLDYTQHADTQLIGIDLDAQALAGAQALAQQQGLQARVSLRQEDAWALSLHDEVDVLASNGLNIYEPDDARVTALYRAYFAALKPGGSLITSFLTPPPMLSPQSPWRLDAVPAQALAFQHLLFVRVIEAKWSVFRTHEQTQAQLREAGFDAIEFIDDSAGMFPTVVARKPVR